MSGLTQGIVTAAQAASTNWLATTKAATKFNKKTSAQTIAANTTQTSTATAALLTASQAVVAALQPAPIPVPPPNPKPAPVTQPTPTPTPTPAPAPTPVPAPPANSVTVSNIAALNAALKAATAGQSILLAAGTYSGLNANGLTWTGVTITSADPANPANPATLTGFYLSNTSGLTFDGLVFDTTGSTDPEPFRINTCSKITLTRLSVHGDLAGAPSAQMSGLFIGSGSDSIAVTKSAFQALDNGIAHSNSTNILIDGNSFHDLGTDGVHGGGSSNVTVSNNHFADFRPDGEHPDAIQFWTVNTTAPATDITVSGNLVEIGDGEPMQGVFLGNELGLTYERVMIANNVVIGGLYNGIAVYTADQVALTGNAVLPVGGQQSWINLQGVTNLTDSGNQATKISIDAGTADMSGNTVISPPADRGAAAIAAWQAAHAGAV